LKSNAYEPWVFICSDSVGETAEAVVKATMRQFEGIAIRSKRFGHIASEDEVREIVEEAAGRKSLIVYTLVQPELREMMKKETIRLGVRSVDIMGPMMQAFIDVFDDRPQAKPGLLHKLDDDYFRRVEAIEFAVKHDDGKDPRGMLQADIVLIGVSRTSKTPLSIYLAHKGYKVANLPLMPEVKPPGELYQVDRERVFGLTMDAGHMLKIRKERLKALGLAQGGRYTSMSNILEELDYAKSLMEELKCTVIDVTEKAIEETAGYIIDFHLKKGGNGYGT